MSSIVESLLTAHARGKRPSAPGVNLRGVNLQNAKLPAANLRDADLRHVDLCNADLQDAYLQGADLWYADLWHANLQGVDLQRVDLRHASLEGADLRNANLQSADLCNADLQNANLQNAKLWGAKIWGPKLRHYGIVALGEIPSGTSCIFPTPAGWVMQVGCWQGSPSDLRDLISSDENWPEARGPEVAHRRPYLEAILVHADLVMAEYDGLIEQLARKWGAA